MEASYLLSADRWRQGRALYATLEAPLDPIFSSLYKHFPEHASEGLRLWKLIGIAALTLLLWRVRPQEGRPMLGLLLAALVVGAYASVPWQTPVAVGEPALWLLLLWARSPRRPFEQGILWGACMGLFPVVSVVGLWQLYRRVEEQDMKSLSLFVLGGIWASLAWLAGFKAVGGLMPYLKAYWVGSWVLWGGRYSGWLWGAAAGALLLLIHQGRVYARQSYSERRLYRDRLWAGLLSLIAPALGAKSLIGAFFLEKFSTPLERVGSYILLGVLGVGFYLDISKVPSCEMVLPPQSCVWGMPPCKVRLAGPYACDWTVPFIWDKARRERKWERFYDKWGEPLFIFDHAGAWTEVSYYLPYLSASYMRKDTFALPFSLYQRR